MIKSLFELGFYFRGKTFVIGLMEAHTNTMLKNFHCSAVWAGDRVHEFAMKVRIFSICFGVLRGSEDFNEFIL